MKIAIIHHKFKNLGGMESYIFSLIKGFAQQGDQVYLYSIHISQATHNIINSQCITKIYSLDYLPRRIRKYLFIHRINHYFDKHQFDLTISVTDTSCQDLLICSNSYGAFIQQHGQHNYYRRLHDKIEIYYKKLAYQSANNKKIIAHSKIIAQELINHFAVPAGKITTIYPPIDTDKFKPVSNQALQKIRKQYHLNNQQINLLFPSLNHLNKGLPELLQAFTKLNQTKYKLLIAGSPPSIPNKLLTNNIQFIGYIDNLAPIYTAVDYTILPSHHEAFGLVVVESLQCGTPVITTQSVGASELLTKQDGLVINNNHPNTIFKAISQLDKTFEIPNDFIYRNHLTIEQHINKLKTISKIL